MQGLLAQQQQSPQQPPQQQTQRKPKQAKDSQETYDIFASLIQKFVFGDAYDGIAKMLKSGQIQESMAFVLGGIIDKTVNASIVSGKKLPPKVIVQAGMELAKWLSEIAQKEGLLSKEEEKQVTENAFYHGMARFAQTAKEDALSPEEAQQYVQLLQMIGGQNQQEPQEMTNERSVS